MGTLTLAMLLCTFLVAIVGAIYFLLAVVSLLHAITITTVNFFRKKQDGKN